MSRNDLERPPDILRGTLHLMVLQTLATIGAAHGYTIVARLEQVSRGALLSAS